jgi:hypothetical protein
MHAESERRRQKTKSASVRWERLELRGESAAGRPISPHSAAYGKPVAGKVDGCSRHRLLVRVAQSPPQPRESQMSESMRLQSLCLDCPQTGDSGQSSYSRVTV